MTGRKIGKARIERRGPRWPAALGAFAVGLAFAALAAASLGITVAGCEPSSPVAISSSLPSVPTTEVPSTASAPSAAPSVPSSTSSTTTTTIYTRVIPSPARIVIPAIEVDAPVIAVGLRDNGAMDLPSFGQAAWYMLGPAPGASGPAVIVGHFDSKKGRDVFYRLNELDQGDYIFVYGEDGDMATFAVDWKEQTLKTELPTDQIWSDTKEPVIRLITCGGEFNRSTGHYLSNVIVYGHLVR